MAELSATALDFLQHVTARVEAKRRAEPAPEPAPADVEQMDRVFRKAAVQHVFSLAELIPEGSDAPEPVRRALEVESYVAPGQRAAGLRSLRRAVRLKYLNQIGTGDAALALLTEAPERAITPTQVIFEQLLSGTLPLLDGLSQSQLFLLDEVQLWAAALGLPPLDQEALDRARMSAQAVASFQHLLTETFVGRDEELRALRQILGIDDPSLRTRLGSVFRGGVPRLIYLEGVGGIGKTSLIGHLLNRFRADDKGPRFAFAYLACDDPGFEILRPEVMLQAAAEQIANHVRLAAHFHDGDPDEGFARVLEDFRLSLELSEQTRAFAIKRSSNFTSQESRLSASREQSTALWHAFAELAQAASRALGRGRDLPLTVGLIVDSFEEVQGRADSDLQPFWDCLKTILLASKALRVVVAGRSPLDRRDLGVPTYHKEMDELGEAAGIDLLWRETGGDVETLRRIRRHIGGNPLNLRLAARVLNQDTANAGALTDIRTRSLWFLRLGPEIIRGRLYQRVLDHIDDSDPRMRKLVHPGMVLRRVTPEIIAQVLAPVCDIQVAGEADAEALFATLGNEHTLVHAEDDGSLRYRQDLRRPVLDLLKADQPTMVRNAHTAAASYYSGRADPVSIAEHTYHRLMLGERPDPFIWDGTSTSLNKAAHRYLATAMEEVPPQGKLFLASELGLGISDELRAAADDADWERVIGPRALQALLSEGTKTALAMLQERKGRTAESPLLAIEARCYLSLADYEKAEGFLQDSLGKLSVIGNPGRRAELTWLLAQARLRAGRRVEGIDTLMGLAELAETLTNPVARVQTLAVLVDLLPEGDARCDPVRNGLAAALAQCPGELFSTEADVIRYGFARVSVEKSAKLASVALMTVSTLYDYSPAATGLEVGPDIVKGLHSLARDQLALAEKLAAMAAEADDKAAYGNAQMLTELADAMLDLTNPDGPTGGNVPRLASVLRGALARSASPEVPLSMAACMGVWWLTQGITGSLMAATLGGLEAYREPWELTSVLEAAA